MSPLEAMTELLMIADHEVLRTIGSENPEMSDYERRVELAVAVIQAMLNTALPVVRFRAHVTIDRVDTEGHLKPTDFTVCGVTMDAIRNGLYALSKESTDMEVTVWEQKAAGADMLTGYRGRSKAPGYRTFLRNLDELENMPTVQ